MKLDDFRIGDLLEVDYKNIFGKLKFFVGYVVMLENMNGEELITLSPIFPTNTRAFWFLFTKKDFSLSNENIKITRLKNN